MAPPSQHKAIPAFYACYLLRSTVRHQSLYVGSTPNPVRRLRQHNGDARGGAVRTSRFSLRPWEMACLVTGFPSKIAALQFEWAWQNTHLTRHVSPSSRLSQFRTAVRYSPKTGRPRKRVERPRFSLSERISNLQILLRTSSFDRWPLKVTFYANDVHRVWQKCAVHHRPDVEVILDESSCSTNSDAPSCLNPESAKGIHAIDVGYGCLKPHLEKSQQIFKQTDLSCTVCHEKLPNGGSMTLICPCLSCTAVTHLQCLASSFLRQEGRSDAVVPVSGNCPSCEAHLRWTDLVRELNLRTRDTEEIEKLFKVKKSRPKKTPVNPDTDDADKEVFDSDEDLDDPLPVADEWHHLSDSEAELDEKDPEQKALAHLSNVPRLTPDRVVQDSDWDDALILT